MHKNQREVRQQALEEYHKRRRDETSASASKHILPKKPWPKLERKPPPAARFGSFEEDTASSGRRMTMCKSATKPVVITYTWAHHNQSPLSVELEQARSIRGIPLDVWRRCVSLEDHDGNELDISNVETLSEGTFPIEITLKDVQLFSYDWPQHSSISLSDELEKYRTASQITADAWQQFVIITDSKGDHIEFPKISTLTETRFPVEVSLQVIIKPPLSPNLLFVCGGCGTSGTLNSVEYFDLAIEKWQSAPRMSENRAWAAVALLGRSIYVCGGRHGDVPYRSVERYDIDEARWQDAPAMLEKRALCSAVAAGDCIYIFGGRHDSGYIISAECFDSKSRSWHALPQMLQERSGPAVGVLGRHAYVCGGQNAAGFLNAVEYFDMDSYEWNRQPPMIEPRTLAAATSKDNSLFICGGCFGNIVFCSVERFNPATQSWDFLPPMTSRRAEAAVTRMGDNIYICGGWDGLTCVSSVECFNPSRYNPETSRWKPIPKMTEPRFAAAAVAIFEDIKKQKREKVAEKDNEELQNKFKASSLVKISLDKTEATLGIAFYGFSERFVGFGWNIKYVKEGGLASAYHLQAEDELVRVNGKRVVDMSEQQVKDEMELRPATFDFLRLLQPSRQIIITFAEDEQGPLGLAFGSFAARSTGDGWKILRVKDGEGMLAQSRDILPGDEITRINGRMIVGMEEEVAVQLMKVRPLTLELKRKIQEGACEALTGFSLKKVGKCVSLSEDRLTAEYTANGSDLFGGVLGDGPIPIFAEGGYFEVRVDNVESGNADGLAIGVTKTPPTDAKQIPITLDAVDSSWLVGFDGRIWNSSIDDFEEVEWYPSELKKDDRVSVLVARSGTMSIFVNDVKVVDGPKDIPIMEPLFPAVDLLGNTKAVTLIVGAEPLFLRNPSSADWFS